MAPFTLVLKRKSPAGVTFSTSSIGHNLADFFIDFRIVSVKEFVVRRFITKVLTCLLLAMFVFFIGINMQSAQGALQTDDATGPSLRDVTPPLVLSTDPLDRAVVPPVPKITISFSEKIAPGANINSLAMKIADGAPVEYNFVINSKELLIFPLQRLAPGSVYSVILPAGAVKDLAGNVLPGEHSFQFTVEAREIWQVPEMEWEKKFGSNGNEKGSAISRVSDGGYIITGSTSSAGAGGKDVYLVKIDVNGTMVWEKTFGGPLDDEGLSVQETKDQGFIITGFASTPETGKDLYLIKTDGNGELKWQKTFGYSMDDEGKNVKQTADGGFIATGYITTYSWNSNKDLYLVKTDASGELQWQTNFGGIRDDEGMNVIATRDGSFVIAGYATQQIQIGYWDYPVKKFLLLKTDDTGSFLWSRHFGGELGSVAYDLEETRDGGFALVGYTGNPNSSYNPDNPQWKYGIENDVFLVKTDIQGKLEWQKTYGYWTGSSIHMPYQTYGRSIEQTDDGGYLLAGIEDYRIGLSEPTSSTYLTKVDDQGNKQWVLNPGGNGALAALQTPDNGYILVGEDDYDVVNGQKDLFIKKLKPDFHNRLPVGYYSSPSTVMTNREITFDATPSIDSDGQPLSYQWDFGDGTMGQGQVVGHSYQRSGVYKAILTVVDPYGSSATCIQIITVTEQQEEWQRVFGGPGRSDDLANVVRQDLDGGFVIAGQVGWVYNAIEANIQADIIKTGPNGYKEWEFQTFPRVIPSSSTSLELTGNAGYIDTGTSLGHTVKIDQQGNQEWNLNIGYDSVKPTLDGGYILAKKNIDGYAILTKLDAGGIKVWERTFDIKNEYVQAIIITRDGDYLIAGYNTASGDIFLLKTDFQGTLLWRKTYGGPAIEKGFSVIEDKAGNYVIAGQTYTYGAGSQDAYLLKVGDTGILLWQQTYGGPQDDEIISVEQTFDGGFILAGDTASSGAGKKDAWVIKTDSLGNLAWQKTFGGVEDDGFRSIQEIPEGGYIAAGYTKSFGFGKGDMYLVRIPMPDNIPPHIRSTTPGDQANGFSPANVLSISLSETVRENALNNGGITLQKTTGEPVPFYLTRIGNLLFIYPKEFLQEVTPYKLTIPSSAVVDLAGNPMSQPYVLTFSTATEKSTLAEDLGMLAIGYADGDNQRNVTKNIILPTSGDNGSNITWTSSDPATIAPDGTVNRPSFMELDKWVALVATITLGLSQESKAFSLLVRRIPPENDNEAVLSDKEQIPYIVGYGFGDSPNHVTQNISLPSSGPSGTTIFWYADNPYIITEGGWVYRPSNEDATVTLRAEIYKGASNAVQYLTVIVKKTDPNSAIILTPVVSGTANNLNGLAWTGSRWLAVGDEGTIIKSPDGINWTPYTSGISTSGSFPDIASDGSKWVLLSDSSIHISTNVDYMWILKAAFWGIKSVSWNGSQWMVAGGKTVWSSPNGINWVTTDLKPQDSSISYIFNDINWSKDRWILAGNNNAILTSQDGINWSQVGETWNENIDFFASAGNNDLYVIVGYYDNTSPMGVILTSKDGLIWSPEYAPGYKFNDIIWNGSVFLLVGFDGENSVIFSSPDGITWEVQGIASSTNLRRIASDGSKWIAAGSGGNILVDPIGIMAWEIANLEVSFNPVDNTNSITQNLTMPTQGVSGVTIKWNSSNPAVLGTDGTVSRPLHEAGNAQVILTATITLGALTDTKEFLLLIKALPLGDVTRDGITDLLDLITLAKGYGTAREQPGFNEAYDLAQDGKIDLFDLVKLVKNMTPH